MDEGETRPFLVSSCSPYTTKLIGGTCTGTFSQIDRYSRQNDRVPNFSSRAEVKAYVGFKPFLRSFPLEIFEAIILFGDQTALARASQASLACLQLFSPRLHRSVKIQDHESLEKMFCQRAVRSPFFPLVLPR